MSKFLWTQVHGQKAYDFQYPQIGAGRFVFAERLDGQAGSEGFEPYLALHRKVIEAVKHTILNSMIQWENTDQFGNLKIATSSATNLTDVELDLRDLAQAVFKEHGEEVTFSVDVAYAEISAPRSDQVSHLLNLPFVTDLIAAGTNKGEIQDALTNQLEAMIGEIAKVTGPWD